MLDKTILLKEKKNLFGGKVSFFPITLFSNFIDIMNGEFSRDLSLSHRWEIINIHLFRENIHKININLLVLFSWSHL